jgi:putative ribosome biogenesis GTPase RsgA
MPNIHIIEQTIEMAHEEKASAVIGISGVGKSGRGRYPQTIP